MVKVDAIILTYRFRRSDINYGAVAAFGDGTGAKFHLNSLGMRLQ